MSQPQRDDSGSAPEKGAQSGQALSPELLRELTERVLALWRRDMELARERQPRRGARR